MTGTNESSQGDAPNAVELAAQLVSAYVSNNSVPSNEVPGLIATLHGALVALSKSGTAAPVHEPATPAQIRISVSPDALMSFEDGRRYKTLRRHLSLRGLSPAQYRAKWGLPPDYPMVAASYASRRSAVARQAGLGRIGGRAASEPALAVNVAPEVPKRAGRPREKADV